MHEMIEFFNFLEKPKKMSDNEHSGNEMEQEEHVDDLAEDEEAPQAVVKSGYHFMRKNTGKALYERL